MKFYQSNTTVGFTVIGIIAIIGYIQFKNEKAKLERCSIYTVAHVDRLHTNRGIFYVTYNYSLNGKRIEDTQSVSSFDTDEPWSAYRRKLAERRLLIRAYCDDIQVNNVLWKIYVPDTLQHIPVNGWKKIPFMHKP